MIFIENNCIKSCYFVMIFSVTRFLFVITLYRRICVHKKNIFYSVGKKTDFLSCDFRCEGPCAFPTVGRKCDIRIHHLNLIHLSSTQTDKPELLLLKSTKSSVEPFLKFTHVRFAIFHNETSCNCDEPEKLR
ncbi:hypothetical protein SAMN05421692_2696 [Chryseobacterium indologenes]|nr:hypothetical protein SAMN05421692_2696 [Chryseobacterium indologenes]SUX51101.1 Uncharacterised protein [Chryseobacterium indologenes]